jgi:hypothetical protein
VVLASSTAQSDFNHFVVSCSLFGKNECVGYHISPSNATKKHQNRFSAEGPDPTKFHGKVRPT